jgi:hypothetical protein
MWGDPATTDLPTPEGLGVYQRLSMAYLATAHPETSEVPIVTFSGRRDSTVGWAEKIPFYAAMQDEKRGGMLFWDDRMHYGVGEWDPMENLEYLRRYRRATSYPALTHCSLDDDPGDGDPDVGTPVGQHGGFVEWDPQPMDQPQVWGVKLSLRDLHTTTGPRAAPDSATVDVTPRRLQQFVVTPLASYAWSLKRLSDGVTVGSGTVNADANGLVTVPAATVYRSGSWLVIRAPGNAGVGARAPATLTLAPERQPARGVTTLAVSWPASGDARLELLDVGGRRVRVLVAGAVRSGIARVSLDTTTLAPGLYFARALEGPARAVARVVVVR